MNAQGIGRSRRAASGVLFGGLAALLTLLAALLPLAQLTVALAILGVAAALALTIAEPAVGLALALVAGPFQPLERVALDLPIDSGQVLLAFALFAYALKLLARGDVRGRLGVTFGPIPLALGGFSLVGVLSVLAARDLADWAFECIKLAQMLLVCLIVANERDPRRRAMIVGAVLLSGLGQATYGVIQHQVRGFGPKEFLFPGSDRYRAYGTFEQPNPFGGYMGLLWPAAGGLAITQFTHRNAPPDTRRSELRNWNWLCGALCAVGAAGCLYALYASGSRGALVGAGSAAVAMAMALLKRPGRWAAAGVLVVFAAFAAGVIQLPASIDAQLAEYGDIDVRDVYLTPINFSTVERLAHWQAAVRMIEAHPWLGVGYGNYPAAYDQYRLIVWVNALGHAHNYYLNVFAETGVIGLLAYLLWWGTVFGVLWRARRRSDGIDWGVIGLLGAFAHLAGHHLFDNLHVANMHLAIGVLLGLAVAWTQPRRAPMP
jgi:putative inorganic carbon (hco3(-)) transporter